jgi:hypothetical protein
MAVDPDPHEWLLAEYQAAMELERAEWKILGNPHATAGDRLTAYARWRAAAERTKVLSIKLRDVHPAAPPSPEPTPHPRSEMNESAGVIRHGLNRPR